MDFTLCDYFEYLNILFHILWGYVWNFVVWFKIISQYVLYQPWATQIGLRAKIMLKCHVEGQNRDFSTHFVVFSMK